MRVVRHLIQHNQIESDRMAAINTAQTPSITAPFIRNRSTWLSYALTFYFGFSVSLVGPLMPFVRDKLALNFTEVGYHFMLLSIGGLIMGVLSDTIASRFGEERMLLGGMLLTWAGLAGLAFGAALEMSLLSTLLYGLGGGTVLYSATAATANANPQHETRAFSEANILGGIGLITGPFLVGGIAASVLGWQAIFVVLPIATLTILTAFRGLPLPKPVAQSEAQVDHKHADAPLPLMFWIFGAMLFMAVAVEFLIAAWGANFLTDAIGYEASTAASLMSVFAVAIVLGRLSGRRLLEWMSSSRLLLLSLVWVLLTFPIFWLGPLPIINIAGLFLMGLGIGNVPPLILSGAMAAASHATGRASARLILFPSLGNLIMLQLMGVLSDEFGIERAYGMVIVLLAVVIVIALSSSRMQVRASAAPA